MFKSIKAHFFFDGAKAGFIFSLDAFVAFSLILVSIQSILVVSSTPSGYYKSLLQAEYLAKDTLYALSSSNSSESPDQQASILDFSAGNAMRGQKFDYDREIIKKTNLAIPYPFSYAYHLYNSSSKEWRLLYNASSDSSTTDIRHGVRYWRVQAAANRLFVGYSDVQAPGDSPYCNVMCKGYSQTNTNTAGYTTPPADCTLVPCNVSKNTFDVGDFNVGILRLTVWG